MSILLTGTTESLQVVLDAAPATNQLPCTASYADQNGSGGDNTVNTNGTTPVTLVASPAASVSRVINDVVIPNADTATRIVTVNKVISGTPFRLVRITLLAGYSLGYGGGRWYVIDPSGNFLESVQAQQSGSWSVSATNGVVNAGNSTTTTLAANGTYTGSSVSVLGYSNVEVIIYSDVASASNGLLIEFSSDGSNWDDSSPFTYTPGTVGPNQGQVFIAGVRAQFMRVVYTNGATIQTTFRLQTVLKTNIIGGDVLSINGTINDNNHGFLAVSQIVGKTTGGGGGYVPVKVNPSGAVTVENNMTQVGGSSVTLGTKTAANSIPVVQASDTSGSSLSSVIVSTTASSSLGLNARNFLRSLQIISVGPVLAAGSVSLTIKDGSGTPIYAVTLPVATGTATQPFTIIDFKNIMVAMNNGGNPVTVSLGTNLTSGSFLVSISGSIA